MSAMTAPTELRDRIANDFAYHAPRDEEIKTAHENVRAECLKLALFIVDNTPVGREQSSALTRLEEVMFHANAAIARQGTAV